jgi:hypothetical protein
MMESGCIHRLDDVAQRKAAEGIDGQLAAREGEGGEED